MTKPISSIVVAGDTCTKRRPPLVARLHADLTARSFDVWRDRVSMSTRGLTFLHEIRDAIDARERFLLVLGPKATTSDYVIAEWQHAVTYGKALNPVLRLGDFLLVPDELKLLHVEDFCDGTRYAFHRENLVRQFSEPAASMGKLDELLERCGARHSSGP